MADSVIVPAASLFVSPRAASALSNGEQLRAVLELQARRGGRRLPPIVAEFLDAIEVAAATWKPAAPGLVPLLPSGTSANENVDRMLSTKETAEILGCSDRWVRELVELKHLEGTRQGSRIKITESSVLEHLLTHRKAAS